MKAALALLFLCATGLLGSSRVTFWIEPCRPEASGCQTHDEQLAEWAIQAWATAAGPRLKLERVPERSQAQLRLVWDNGRTGLYGEAVPFDFHGRPGAELHVRPDVSGLGPSIAQIAASDPLFRDAVVYLTCQHEAGHGLGIQHTADFKDLMYSFQFGGDIIEYFQRFRRKLVVWNDMRRMSGISDSDRKEIVRRYALE